MVMDEMNNTPSQPNPPRRRRKRTKAQIFREAYLPYIIMGVALILIIVFISGSIRRGKSENTGGSFVSAEQLLQQEAQQLSAEAEALAMQYDYEGAMAVLSRYTGGLASNVELNAQYTEYANAYASVVTWNDLSKVPNLSFRSLIVDADRAFADATYGERYAKNYITVNEFKAILQQLYDNGYVLVSIYDVVPTITNDDGTITFGGSTVKLPADKTPIILTQEAANYFTYMTDSDGDGLADAGGDGFACKLLLDDEGQLTSQYVQADGSTVTGSYSLIPILNDFIAEHPDFSYNGAKAIISVCGYDGIFGYRIDPETATKISQDYYDQELASVGAVVEKLRSDGYDLACYTYNFLSYNQVSSSEIKADLNLWNEQIVPYLGEVDILVYPNSSDISDYSGTKYEILSGNGFRYYIGLDSDTASWGKVTEDYARQTRRWVTGSNLIDHADWFADLFTAADVLDSVRG